MKRFVNNWPFKVLSLILSIVLWLYVAGELERRLWSGTKEVTFNNVPIKTLGFPEEEFKIEINPNEADIVLYSYKSNVESINREDTILFVDLSNLRPGTYELYVQNIIPEEFYISKINPSAVIVTILGKN